MKNSLRFPAKDGWIHAKLKLTPGATVSQEEALRFATLGPPDLFEVGAFSCLKTVAHIYYRRHRMTDDQFEAVAHALGVSSADLHKPLWSCEAPQKGSTKFTRNRYVTAAHEGLDNLVEKHMARKTAPIEIFEGDRIYEITGLGMAVFRYEWEQRQKEQAELWT